MLRSATASATPESTTTRQSRCLTGLQEGLKKMVAAIEPLLREQLLDRRQKLETVAHGFHRPTELSQLLLEVDAALDRMDRGVYGLCEVCHDPVEPERLLADPLQ